MKISIKLDVFKSLERNAGVYFDKAKKTRKKIEGAEEAIKKTEQRLIEFEEKRRVDEIERKKKVEIKREWYEKFRWFFSSEGFLCIGGRDATTNEIVIKKHTEKDDVVFHTEMAGSPFFVIKTIGQKVGEKTLNETSQATAAYSRAWKLGMGVVNTFYVKPEQVSKEVKPGEFIAKGAFMIYGKKNFINSKLGIAVGIKAGKIIGGPVDAVKAHSDKFVIIKQGNEKASSVAKKIRKKLNGGELDDIIRFLPAGGCAV